MYHRYMPTGNGQFRRQAVPDPPEKRANAPRPPIPQRPEAPPIPPMPPQPPKPPVPPEKPCAPSKPPAQPIKIPFLEKFLGKLLPGFDNGDLLVLLIILLLLAEGTEDSTSTIMTLAIFLFMQ